MKKLFPKHLLSGSVKTQEELEKALDKYSNYSKPYIWIAISQPKYRKWYEDNWSLVHKYLDKDFIERFKSEEEYVARSWEFHIAVVLKNYNIPLLEKIW